MENHQFVAAGTGAGLAWVGRKLIQKAIAAIENADERFFSCLSEEQLEVYRSLTSAVITNNDV
jgi:hypothetical protein